MLRHSKFRYLSLVLATALIFTPISAMQRGGPAPSGRGRTYLAVGALVTVVAGGIVWWWNGYPMPTLSSGEGSSETGSTSGGQQSSQQQQAQDDDQDETNSGTENSSGQDNANDADVSHTDTGEEEARSEHRGESETQPEDQGDGLEDQDGDSNHDNQSEEEDAKPTAETIASIIEKFTAEFEKAKNCGEFGHKDAIKDLIHGDFHKQVDAIYVHLGNMEFVDAEKNINGLLTSLGHNEAVKFTDDVQKDEDDDEQQDGDAANEPEGAENLGVFRNIQFPNNLHELANQRQDWTTPSRLLVSLEVQEDIIQKFKSELAQAQCLGMFEYKDAIKTLISPELHAQVDEVYGCLSDMEINDAKQNIVHLLTVLGHNDPVKLTEDDSDDDDGDDLLSVDSSSDDEGQDSATAEENTTDNTGAEDASKADTKKAAKPKKKTVNGIDPSMFAGFTGGAHPGGYKRKANQNTVDNAEAESASRANTNIDARRDRPQGPSSRKKPSRRRRG